MRGDFDGELQRRMEEASLLPHDHPARQAVGEAVARAGKAAQDQWVRLQGEPEEFRLALRDVATPAGLEQRLFDIPLNAARRRRRVRVPVAVVAAMLTVAVVIVVMTVRPPMSSTDRLVARVASLVAEDHTKHSVLTVIAADRQELVTRLQPGAPFEVRLPAAEGALIGGRICRLGERPLVLTRWSVGDREVSMYQIRLVDFDLPPNMPRREIDPPDRGSSTGRCRVRVWSDDQFAYATVTDAL